MLPTDITHSGIIKCNEVLYHCNLYYFRFGFGWCFSRVMHLGAMDILHHCGCERRSLDSLQIEAAPLISFKVIAQEVQSLTWWKQKLIC